MEFGFKILGSIFELHYVPQYEAKYDFKQNVFAHYMHFTNSFNSAQTSCVNHRNNGEFIPASVGPLVSTNSIRNQVIFMILMQAGDSPIVN